MTDLISSMRAARNTPHIALQQYMLCRSRFSTDFVCVFEGVDDLPYYDTVFKMVRADFGYRPLIVNGKDQVLGLRDLLEKRSDSGLSNMAFFIDRDFDGYKGREPADNVYCTHGYSIENNLFSFSVVESLLLSDYQCIGTEDEESVPEIISILKARVSEFVGLMEYANRLIFFARRTNVRLSAIENQVTKYLLVDLDRVCLNPKGLKHDELVGWASSQEILSDVELDRDFNELIPLQDWRGKFVKGIYIELLHKLKEDRCSSSPRFFKRRSAIKFNPKGEIVRTLAVLAPVPDCLRKFASSLGGAVANEDIAMA